jgi:hypothetical protein
LVLNTAEDGSYYVQTMISPLTVDVNAGADFATGNDGRHPHRRRDHRADFTRVTCTRVSTRPAGVLANLPSGRFTTKPLTCTPGRLTPVSLSTMSRPATRRPRQQVSRQRRDIGDMTFNANPSAGQEH